jgi:putative phosphonate metabolism protein
MGLLRSLGKGKFMFVRYAIFYTPPPGPLTEFGAGWLGWDSRRGTCVAHLDTLGFDVSALTHAARKYGFHGTLMAPFHLAAGTTQGTLMNAVEAFVKTTRAATVDSLSLQHYHGFLALRPDGKINGLNRLAERIVTDFASFRAPATPDELARKRKTGLTARQDLNLVTWGYPHVLDDFQFHLTLTGRIDAETAMTLIKTLGPQITHLLPRPFRIDHIALMGQDKDGMFHEIQRYALTG